MDWDGIRRVTDVGKELARIERELERAKYPLRETRAVCPGRSRQRRRTP